MLREPRHWSDWRNFSGAPIFAALAIFCVAASENGFDLGSLSIWAV